MLIQNTDTVFVDYSAMNWDDFNDYLCNVNWSEIYTDEDDGDQRWFAFSTTVIDAISRFARTSIRRVRKAAAHSYPHHIRKLTSKKALLWNKARQLKTKELNKAYRESAIKHCT